MKVLNIIKKNLFLVAVLLAYIVLFIVKPDMGVASVKNSGYYIKEMLMIMPVILILTALLDIWVPKQTIIKYLGRESKWKGAVLSLILGGISAGPIYAAFPFCVMLHKKGASIKNIVIILSSWAVIKAPMLLNEVKFLGVKFMAVRWALTVIAILVFSWIASKLIRDSDLPQFQEEKKAGVSVNRSACMGCTLCAKSCPEVFEMRDKKACVREQYSDVDKDKLQKAADACPVQAIEYRE